MKRPVWPASALGRWAFWLGVATVVWGVLMIPLRRVLAPVLSAIQDMRIPIPLGLTSAIIEVLLAVAAIVVGVVALAKRERSRLVLLAFVLAAIVGGFWILFALGEVLWPH